MRKYDLIVQNRQGEWIHAELGNEEIAMNFQVNDIAELKTMSINWSQEIRLPVTRKNSLLFDILNEPSAASRLPYKFMHCRLTCEGATIAGKGTVIILNKTTPTYFSCQIVSGNKDFFEWLKNKPFTDLDFGTYRVLNSSLNTDNWTNDKTKWPDAQACFMGAATFIARNTYPAGKDNVFLPATGGNYPFVRIPSIIRAIEAESSYTIDDSEVAHLYENHALSLSDVSSENNNAESFDYMEIKLDTKSIIHSQYIGIVFLKVIKDNDNETVQIPIGNDTTSGYNSVIDGTLLFSIKDFIPSNIELFDRVEVHYRRKRNGIYEDIFARSYYAGDEIIERINVITGDIVYPLIYLYYNIYNYENVNVKVSIRYDKSEPSNAGAFLKISERLGFATCLDFFKFIAEAYGLIFITSESHSKITVFNIKKLYSNRETARVGKSKKVLYWSDKLQKNSYETDFTFGSYAQKNYLKMEDNEADGITNERAAVTINNVNLNFEKDMYSLPVQAGRDFKTEFASIFQTNIVGNVASIPLIELPEPESETGAYDVFELFKNAKFSKIKPHIVKNTGVSYNIKISANPEVYKELPFIKSVTAQELVAANYAGLQKMLENVKVIEADFNLTPFDIQGFNPQKPVYVQQFGAFFYLQKIANYRIGKLTRIKLVRL